MSIKKLAKKHGSSILSVLGCIGLVGTAVLAVTETPKAIGLIAEKRLDKEEELTKAEMAVTVAPVYIPAIVVGVSSIACILGANVLNKRTQASLMSAYSLADQAYKQYRGKNIELFGEDNDKAIMQDLARKYCNFHALDIDTPDAKVTWVEPISGRTFEAYERTVMDAEYHFNRNYALAGVASTNSWMEMLGLPPVKDGDEFGWGSPQEIYWVDFEHHKQINDDGTVVYYIDPVIDPYRNYEEF